MSSYSNIKFGTDGWRAIIGDDYTYKTVRAVAGAAGLIWTQDQASETVTGNTIIIGYDTRFQAGSFARAAAERLALQGFRVLLSDRYIPTPGVCYCISKAEEAIGGLMFTASHNPSDYLGIKVRMADGGASPVSFTDRIEAMLQSDIDARLTSDTGEIIVTDLLSLYTQGLIDTLELLQPKEPFVRTSESVIVDPLYGAGQTYLSDLLLKAGAEPFEIHDDLNPSFGGLHPEPIPPWTDSAREAVLLHQAKAAFVTDGDGDRIGAIDENGNFVSPHRIIALLAQHLIEDVGLKGRIVKSHAASVTINRLGAILGTEVTTTPIGFKWIYEQMLEGDVLIGGEESGGIGIPMHVRERDGLLMALLLLQMMQYRQKTLGQLVDELLELVGTMYYQRSDNRISDDLMEAFRADVLASTPTEVAGLKIISIDRTDGLKMILCDDQWLLLRGSGTEPLVRVYAEGTTEQSCSNLIEAGVKIINGQVPCA